MRGIELRVQLLAIPLHHPPQRDMFRFILKVPRLRMRADNPTLKNPLQIVVTADFAPKMGVNLRMDNNKMPFRPNSFDLIVMSRGLCPCHGSVSCGGIAVQRTEMTNFLVQLISVLNKNNPHSLAILTGFAYPGIFRITVPELWSSIIAEMRILHPELEFFTLDSRSEKEQVSTGFRFIGIAVSRRSKTSIIDKLKSLDPNLAP